MKKNVCVITGGGSGMGLAAAKCMPKDKIIVVTGRAMFKLEKAVKELEELGFEAYAKTCDTSKREQVRELAEFAVSLGEIKNVINSAGLSPAMADPEKLIRVCSLSPGLIATDMGNLESEEGGNLLNTTAERRMGKPEELGFAIASVADERNGYLAGVDVLVDGGSVNGKEFVR